MAKTVKAKNLTPVKTKNPLINGSFDEAAAREVLRMVKENDIKIIDLKFNPRMVNSPRLAAVPLENLVSIPRSLLRGSLLTNDKTVVLVCLFWYLSLGFWIYFVL